MKAQCDWNAGNIIGFASDLTGVSGLLKDIAEGALRSTIGDVMDGQVKDIGKDTLYDSIGNPDENDDTKKNPGKDRQQRGEEGMNDVGDKIDEVTIPQPVDNTPKPPRLKPHPVPYKSEWPESQNEATE